MTKKHSKPSEDADIRLLEALASLNQISSTINRIGSEDVISNKDSLQLIVESAIRVVPGSSAVIYIYDEMVLYKHGNREAYDKLIAANKLLPDVLIVADSAEPKSISDFRDYGANIRGAEKGEGSVDYSIKWLASRAKIVIDPVRCPHHTDEFLNYELEQTKDGEYITAYPDKNNHCIDRTRYAHNLIWRRRGQ